MYACLGDDGVDWDKEWLGIPDAYKVKEVSGQGDGDFVLYHDCLVDISEFEYYDEEYDNWYPYTDNPENFEAYYSQPENKNELITRLKESIMMYRDKSLMEEGWLGDKMKAGWDKVKSGAKKVGKAIGDAFKGPFRKGDQIVMKGEDGEEFKGTIKSFDLGEKTYEVLLGNAVNEGLEEDVLEMGDRVDELEAEIEKLWARLGDLPGDKNEVVLNLISNYVELEKLEPGRVDFEESTLVNEETREERAYLRSIGEYDGYLGKKKPAKRKWGGASKKSARKPIRRPVAKKEYRYSFSASGYGTKTYSFPSEEECLKEMKQDAEATAAEYNGEVQWWDDKECVVVDGDGQELGSFEYLGARR